jgi:hypothetical protein
VTGSYPRGDLNHLPTPMCCLLSSRSAVSDDWRCRTGGSDGRRPAAGGARADRGDGLVTAHVSADGVAWQPGWVATLTPFSVDGMIVAASTTLLADSRSGNRGRPAAYG